MLKARAYLLTHIAVDGSLFGIHSSVGLRVTSSFCVPLLSYGFGIDTWIKPEVAQFDVSTRRNLSATNNHHPRSAVEHVYLLHSAREIGFINIESLYNRKLVSLAHHLCASTYPWCPYVMSLIWSCQSNVL